MRKVLLAFMLLLGGTIPPYAMAGEPFDVTLHIIDKGRYGSGNGKAPHRPLVITQDGNILTLPAMSVDYTLELRDETGAVVYTVYLPAGTTQVVLPSYLEGDFELRLMTSTYYYLGYINL